MASLVTYVQLAGTGMGITVLPGTLLYLNGQLLGYMAVLAVGMAVAFILTTLFFKSEE